MQRSNDPKLIVKGGAFYAYLPPLTDEEYEEALEYWMEDYREAGCPFGETSADGSINLEGMRQWLQTERPPAVFFLIPVVWMRYSLT